MGYSTTNSDILKKAMISALENSLGIVTTACKEAGVARDTHYRWLKEDEEYKKAVEDVAEMTLDFAESQLYKQIKEGEIVPTIFYLKTKGKKRGYIERSEQEITVTKPIIIDWNNDTPDTKAEGSSQCFTD